MYVCMCHFDDSSEYTNCVYLFKILFIFLKMSECEISKCDNDWGWWE